MGVMTLSAVRSMSWHQIILQCSRPVWTGSCGPRSSLCTVKLSSLNALIRRFYRTRFSLNWTLVKSVLRTSSASKEELTDFWLCTLYSTSTRGILFRSIWHIMDTQSTRPGLEAHGSQFYQTENWAAGTQTRHTLKYLYSTGQMQTNHIHVRPDRQITYIHTCIDTGYRCRTEIGQDNGRWTLNEIGCRHLHRLL